MTIMCIDQHDNLMHISLSLYGFFGIVILAGCLGGIVGFILGRRKGKEGSSDVVSSLLMEKSTKGGGFSTTDDDLDLTRDREHLKQQQQQKNGQQSSLCTIHQTINEDKSNEAIEVDGPTLVLRGSLKLMASQWGGGAGGDSFTNNNSKVVEYLSPERLTELLFSKAALERTTMTRGEAVADAFQTLRLDDNDEDDFIEPHYHHPHETSSSSMMTTITRQPEAFLHLLSLIQKYSVNTSHPYFFNQLFGALDPIALAAEIVALSVNTSVYTYETAPVFTLLEREVMGQIGKLVFERRGSSSSSSSKKQLCPQQQKHHGDDEEEEEFVGEGLMIPGGSLANLTAMHAARHRWKVRNGYTRRKQEQQVGAYNEDHRPHRSFDDDDVEEEKKVEDSSCHDTDVRHYSIPPPTSSSSAITHHYDYTQPGLTPLPDLVALVSSEAHYSFAKSARILGLREDDLIVIPTHADGRMDVKTLAKKLEELEFEVGCSSSSSRVLGSETRIRVRMPFFVACTAGSTVRGSFDEIADIVTVCREYEARGCSSSSTQQQHHHQRSIWVHVDGAWGGSAIFSSRSSVRSITHMDEIRHADSFTFNPHKMLGAPQQTTAFIVRHRNALRDANAAGAKYLFDPRKNGAEYDLGDLSYTCGRRTDAVKLWALWKYYGRTGLGCRVDQKVDELALFVEEIHRRPSFALACKPWPFNVNFFYFPPRIRRVLEARGVIPRLSLDRDRMAASSLLSLPTSQYGEDESIEDYIQIPDDIAKDLANVSVVLKLRMHEAGEMIIPYQVRQLSSHLVFYHCFKLTWSHHIIPPFSHSSAAEQPNGGLLSACPRGKEVLWLGRYPTRSRYDGKVWCGSLRSRASLETATLDNKVN